MTRKAVPQRVYTDMLHKVGLPCGSVKRFS